MKIMTILGTRPEIIRLSIIIATLDRRCTHTLVHTGQNFDPNLSDVFFAQLGVRRPNHFLEVRSSTFGEQIGQILAASERILTTERPDRLLLLGDTNSALAAIVAKRMGIPVYHMEAGNRAYDDRVPEEINRRIIDHCSDVLMPYTERSRANLLREGIEGRRIFVTGNPIFEVVNHHSASTTNSDVLERLKLQPGRYILATMHRAENVDIESRLRSLVAAFEQLAEEHQVPVVCSTHPRTQGRMREYRISDKGKDVRFLEPFGFFDFIALEQKALCVLSDSGTVQEECCIFQVPNVTIRDVTERPETIECGSNILSGAEPEAIMRCVRTVLEQKPSWVIPREYLVKNVSQTVVKILLGYLN